MIALLRRARALRCAIAVMVLMYGKIASAQAAGAAHGMNLDRIIRTFVLAEQLEIHANAAERPLDVELVSWIGGDYNRLFLRAQGEQSTRVARGGDLQGDVLYGRLLTPFWSAVAGARVDTRQRTRLAPGNPSGQRETDGRLTRGMLALGFIGLAPGWFEMEPTLFISDEGDVSFEFESSFDLLFTQRLILQPRLELNAAVQSVREIGVGAGLNDVEIGARMRYEIRRKFAPYLGVSLLRRTGATAALAHDLGERRTVGTIAVGLRLWR